MADSLDDGAGDGLRRLLADWRRLAERLQWAQNPAVGVTTRAIVGPPPTDTKVGRAPPHAQGFIPAREAGWGKPATHDVPAGGNAVSRRKIRFLIGGGGGQGIWLLSVMRGDARGLGTLRVSAWVELARSVRYCQRQGTQWVLCHFLHSPTQLHTAATVNGKT